METSKEVDLSPEVGETLKSRSDSLYLGDELGLDLWVSADTSRAQSLLIRATFPSGTTRSSFMHIDGRIEQIPIFNDPDPLILDRGKKIENREFTWSEEIKEEKRFLPKVFKFSAVVIALILLASSFSGLLQLRVVLTGSMKPTINPGDLVVALSTDLIEPKIGKVVIYGARDLDGKMVTVWAHRIISGDSNQGFIIKGDANDKPDIGRIPPADIQSVVILHLPRVGSLFNIYSLVFIFSGLILISFAKRGRSKR